MARYSRKALAQLIADGYDSAAAANVFNRSVNYIEKEQQSSQFQSLFRRALQQRRSRLKNGWTPVIGNVDDDERRVQQIIDWEGGQGRKPRIGQYIGEEGYVDDIADATDIRGKEGIDGEGEGGAGNFFKVSPFHRGVHGRFHRGVRAFPEARIMPFYRGIQGGFHRGIQGSEKEKRQQDTRDILALFDGVPGLVADYFYNLIQDRLAPPTELRDADQTYALIRSHIEGYVTGYTEAFTDALKTKLESTEIFTDLLKTKLETTEIFTNTLKTKLEGVENEAKDDQTGSEIIGLLNALPIGSRLNINWLDGNLSIPTNTASWHGAFQLNTAYTAGSIVTDNNNVYIYIVNIPETNTTRPGNDNASRVEHLDVGSPLDITNISKSGLAFTITRRNGAVFTLTISSADILTAIQNMDSGQKAALRTVIGNATTTQSGLVQLATSDEMANNTGDDDNVATVGNLYSTFTNNFSSLVFTPAPHSVRNGQPTKFFGPILVDENADLGEIVFRDTTEVSFGVNSFSPSENPSEIYNSISGTNPVDTIVRITPPTGFNFSNFTGVARLHKVRSRGAGEDPMVGVWITTVAWDDGTFVLTFRTQARVQNHVSYVDTIWYNLEYVLTPKPIRQ